MLTSHGYPLTALGVIKHVQSATVAPADMAKVMRNGNKEYRVTYDSITVV